jgi:hypothetical protein
MATVQFKPALADLPPPTDPAESYPFSVDLRRTYRAHVTPQDFRRPERTIFITAYTERSALERMAQAVAGIDRVSLRDAAERIYNVNRCQELFEQGLSPNCRSRIFETGWSGGEAIAFVTHPLFLIEDAGPLITAWAAISQAVQR